ncbi:RidA family protein [Providencia rustigianii]|uniref:Enamine/imine deaminase n=1 Tax=Providencia rustigianii TaxID=158850 RepID=A0A379G3Q9_9GAMM|nr:MULTISPECIES: RidA family protein [Providencia]MTC57500.1 RidA family protein [Providencia rustigianii]MTC61071.1 RidA family protein [Providencia rustigianii]SUC35577.1 Enamine/imine deaminase [Providencia rustigianii]VEH55486.1 Enamine/imine deaminase [Providencia rustigianii]
MKNSITYTNAQGLIPPRGHYSHCVTANGFIFISGQLPVDSHGTVHTNVPFAQQAEQVLSNLEACLTACGVGKQHLVQVRVYIADMNDWQVFNQIYATWIGEYRPARAVAGVSELHFGAGLEIEATAVATN